MNGERDRARILSRTLTMVLAGGQGERLYPLTRDRAKPAVPFGGNYRLIDFTLSNCLHSGLRQICVLTQYKSDSLNRHVRLGWNIFNPEIGEFIEIIPPQQRLTSHWYLGTADAIYQNIYTLEKRRPPYVLILSGDHVYKMDYSRMLLQHLETDADVTIACIPTPLHEASRFGVMAVDNDFRVAEFEEKPPSPKPVPGSPDRALCSMGIYAFKTEILARRVIEDSKTSVTHDFGHDVIPAMIRGGDRVFAYKFVDENRKETLYWRDIGTLDSFWEANMDLVQVEPLFNLYDPDWSIRTYLRPGPPAKTVFAGGPPGAPKADVCDALLCNGAIISGARVRSCIIGGDVHIEVGSEITQTVIMGNVRIGRNVVIRRAVIDKGNCIPDGLKIGEDPEQDRRLFTISAGGIAVVPKGMPLFHP